MSEELDTAARYRQQAEELRVIAADIEPKTNRDRLLSLAAGYERVADTMEAIDKTNKAMNRPR